MFRPAGELAAMVRGAQLSARELVGASLARIDELEPQIGAFTYVAHESALAEADPIRAGDPRPFAGVPIAIKDNRPVAGMPLTMGSDLWGDFTPGHDAFLVSRLRAAGFVIVGKTALPEMSILPTTESRRFGPTRNPWDLERTPGGSSGGAAAAVASGMLPLAHGNDGGGSLRIPGACCGLVGLKPARGRVSSGPDGGQSFLGVDGVLTHTVSETAQLLDILAGYEPGDATWAPPPTRSYAELAARGPHRLRIGLAVNPSLQDAALDPACEAAARQAAALLESLGHYVEQIEPPWAELDVLPSFTKVFCPQASMTTLAGAQLAGREPLQTDVEPLTWEVFKRARAQNVIDYLRAQGHLERAGRTVVSYLQPYDAILTPALARRPLRIGEINGQGPDPWANYRRSGYFTPYTGISNITGQPAIVLPLYQGDDGLPMAIQLIGPPARDELLLSLGAQLEQAQPWAGRRPAAS